eukprot:Phypoly_transcript_06861.p1 GENE.Phypoly_transcript_06861~~Phypoly_transcript_06861.p1  ORF type:complete len:286 (+),score=100.26 Phypoly_transcript_06861:752-1609(+)
MTSKEIEEYVAEIKSKRTLTAAEEKDLKKQRRLVKNREYASQSRSRKKQFVDELEKQLEAARAETEEVKKQNKALMDENKLLKRQLGCIAETIKKSQLNAGKEIAASSSGATPTPLSASSGSIATSVFDKLKIGHGRSVAAASKGFSACVLAIFFMVFTFAAFWDNEANFAKHDVPTFRGSRTLFAEDLSYFESEGVWEAASALLRQSWEASADYLPSWDSAYSLFISSYPIFFSPSSSSSSSSSATPLPITKPIVPTCTEHAHPVLPPTNNNETKRCAKRGSAS